MKKLILFLVLFFLTGCASIFNDDSPTGIKVIPNDPGRVAQVQRCIKEAEAKTGYKFGAKYLEVSFRPSNKYAWSNTFKENVAVSPDGVPAYFTGTKNRHGIVCFYRADNGVFHDQYLVHEVAHSIAYTHGLFRPSSDGVHYDGFKKKGIIGW